MLASVMNFTFLHAADLHLGSPLTGLSSKDEAVAERFAGATREAFSALVTAAIEQRVDFVLIAGDIYDGAWKDASIALFFNREVARLARAAIPVFIIKGNHDAESVVTRAVPLPETVSVFPTQRAKTLELEQLKVAIHGRSFPDRAVDENWALTYPDPLPGWFNIGLLHTSCDGREGHASYAPCSTNDLVRKGYDYWALGHVHEYEVVAREPWIVFPGNLQGRSVRECGAKGAVLVRVRDGIVSAVEPLALDRARWAQVEVDVTGCENERELLDALKAGLVPVAAQADGRLVAVRVRARGTTRLHRRLKADPRRYCEELQALAQHLYEDLWIESLKIETRELETHVADPAVNALDPAALLEGLEHDAELREKAAALVASLKFPPGLAEEAGLDGALDDILADARALVLGRAAAPAER